MRPTSRFLIRSGIQLFIGLVVLELLLRLYNPLPFRLRGNTILLRPYEVFAFHHPEAVKLDRVIYHRANSLGFRGPEVPADLSTRVSFVAVGGSTTECILLNDGRTWTDRLGELLARDLPRLWFNNAGLDGHSTFGHLILVEDYLVKLRPTFAMFLVGLNDVAIDSSTWSDDAMLAANRGRIAGVTVWLIDHSEVAMMAQNFWRARRAREARLIHDEIDFRRVPAWIGSDFPRRRLDYAARNVIPRYRDRLNRLIALCRSAGIEPILITQPVLYGGGPDPSTGIDFANLEVNRWGTGEREWRLLELYNQATRAVGRDRQVTVVDLAHELPKDSQYFYDFVHFTNAGAARVAEILYVELRPFFGAWLGEHRAITAR